MFEEQVVPRIRALAPNDSCQIRLRTFGLPESVVGERLAGVEEGFPGVTIGYRAHFPEIEVKVLARGKAEALARELCDKATIEVRSRLADVVYGDGDDSFAGVVGRALRGRGYTLAIAESCTGGLVGHMVTREPGASDFLMVDAVTYANSAKTRFLGVDEDVLRGHGAVSAEVAAAMAEGVRRVSGADIALSLTGIAGPSGGSAEKPVGTVYLAIASPKGTLVKHRVVRRGAPPGPDPRRVRGAAARARGLRLAIQNRGVHSTDCGAKAPGKIEGRLATAILLTAVVPLVVALSLANALFKQASAIWFDPEVGRQLDRGVDVYKDYVKAIKDDMRHQTDAIAADEVLREAAKTRNSELVEAQLDRSSSPASRSSWRSPSRGGRRDSRAA